jgi:hypothetical protein
MTSYSKLLAAVVTVLLMRWVLRWTGLDVAELGVQEDFQAVVYLAVDAVAAAVSGFFVWLVPNVRMKLRDLWRRAKAL